MINGVGVDLCKIERIRALYEKSGTQFVQRILTPEEQTLMKNVADPVPFLAKRFAAKEAVSKALGVGIGRHLSFQDIEIQRKSGQRPIVLLYKKGYEHLHIHISLSDEEDYAMAYVITEINPKEGP